MVDRIVISVGDFLKNAGLVGLKYLLDKSDADEGIEYGITEDEQALWLDREFVKNADWTDMYFKAFVERYGPSTAYCAVLEKIENILEKARLEGWDKKSCKEDLRFINDKLLSNSYKSGFASIKQDIDDPEAYEQLSVSKLKESMETEELCARLRRLKCFLEQPLCKETFSMKSIIYNYINRFWDGKSFLLRSNASKDMKEVFDADFSGPLRMYAAAEHKKSKDMCIECSSAIDSKEKVSIAFMKDQADDLSRKRSAFWNCKVDAWICPVCSFVYSLVPLGFVPVGNTFLFININTNVRELLRTNAEHGKTGDEAKQGDGERYSSWLARTVNILLREKVAQLGNIQVITRGIKEDARYTFDVISKDVIRMFEDDMLSRDLYNLSKYPYIKDRDEFWNVHENVILNILRYNSQYAVINKLLKKNLDGGGTVSKATLVYDIQLRTGLLRKIGMYENTGGDTMKNQMKRYYALREEGYELRKVLLGAKGGSDDDDASIRGIVYKLLNTLSVGNVEHFMEILMRIYCSTKLSVPGLFIELLNDKDTFMDYGYAFLLGLQGSRYEKKEEVTNG